MTEDFTGTPNPSDPRGLTSADIYNREFHRVMFGGYDMREVDEYLARVADAFESMAQQLQTFRERDREQRNQIEAFHEMEESLRSALVTSQKFTENLMEAAKREAEALIEQAHLTKARAQFEAARLPAEMAEDVRRLQEQRDRLRAELLAILDTHTNLLNTTPLAERRVGIQAPKTPGEAAKQLRERPVPAPQAPAPSTPAAPPASGSFTMTGNAAMSFMPPIPPPESLENMIPPELPSPDEDLTF